MNSITWWSATGPSGSAGEDRGLVRLLDVRLDRHQAFLARLRQDLVQQRQQVDVDRLAVGPALEQARQGLEGGLDVLGAVAGDEGTGGATEDDQQFEWLEQGSEVATGQDGTRRSPTPG
jgi:hypothetical protein